MHYRRTLARFLALTALCLPPAAAAQWQTTHFELFFGEPWYVGNPNLTSIGRAVDENLFSLDDAQDRPAFISQSTVDEIELYLHETALRLEAMGFRAPELEPLLRAAAGRG